MLSELNHRGGALGEESDVVNAVIDVEITALNVQNRMFSKNMNIAMEIAAQYKMVDKCEIVTKLLELCW